MDRQEGRTTLCAEPGDLLRRLDTWSAAPDVTGFPYDDVVAQILRTGKHFTAGDLLDALCRAKSALVTAGARGEQARLLAAFLDTALDKRDNRYDYLSYTATAVLGLANPATGLPEPVDPARADRLLMLLVADILGHELAGPRAPLPRMRPPWQTTVKRARLGLRILVPLGQRTGRPLAQSDDVVTDARAAVEAVRGNQTPLERRMLTLSLLPVDTVHDEYMFIRVLQSFETYFTQMGVLLRGAIADLVRGDATGAAAGLDRSAFGFRTSAPLFSLLATMGPESFRTFREFTEGASAIQSVGYKTVESLCRLPDPQRLDSIAYRSVPGVRADLMAGRATIEAAFESAVLSGLLSGPDLDEVVAAMGRLGAACHRWKQTHVRLAERMLGAASGTGYTEGVPYLRKALHHPLFTRVGDEPKETR